MTPKPDPTVNRVIRWGLLWRQNNKLEGIRQHIIFENCLPALFTTRKRARKFADERYGYIRHREDLRAEPFGWRMPTTIRISIERAP